MESNETGADRAEFLERKRAEKQAKFDAIRKYLHETNARPYTRDEVFRMYAENTAENRRLKEQQRQPDQDNPQHSPDNAA